MKNKTVARILLALSLTGFGLFPALAQTVSGEGDATPAQIAVLPGQTLRNYAPWDPATSDVPALPLPADINADTGAISGGSNPASVNVFRTRVFDLDFTGVTIPPCPDGSPATDTNVVITMQFTGDQSNGSGVDLFVRMFTNGDTVLDGVDLVGDDVFGTQVIKFKQLVPVADLDTVQLLVSFQTLEGTIQFNWSMDILGVDLAPDCPVTGDAELDFPLGSPNTAVAYDPGFLDVSVDPGAPEGTISGFDAIDVRFRLDEIDDLMYVAINTDGVGGDADGNGDPTTTAAWMANNGGSDSPDYGVNEAVVVILDIDTDGVPDVVAGVPYSQSINEYSVALLGAGNPLSNFGAPLPSHTGEVLNNPGDGTTPDLIFTITNWSTLPTSGVDADERSFSYVMFQGSTGDLAMGEEWSPGIAEFGPVVIPPEVSDLGSIGNLVWFDTDGDGVFDDGEESGIPGVVVLLLDADGNEIGQQITDADGGYLFTDLPMGVYTVEIAASNFDDCGTPIYKSGKWALGSGLEFDGTNVVFQPGVAAVSGALSIAVQVQPDLSGNNWSILVEKGNGPWPYTLWLGPDGKLCLELTGADGAVEYVYSTGKLNGSLQHVAVTYDGSSVSFYIDGALDSTSATSIASIVDSVGDLYLGRWYSGTINDLRVYDTALDAVEIEALASMECGALAGLSQSTVLGGTVDGENKATPQQVGLAEGQDIVWVDFGYMVPSSIGNTVWNDTDQDGVFEPQGGEQGIAGVLVLLKDASGAVVATATTDVNGQYLFDNLVAGTYTVEIDDSNQLPGGVLEGYVQSGATYTQLADGLNRSDPHGVDLGIGEDYIIADFGFHLPSTGNCWEGLTPGFWKQSHHFDAWVNYSPTDTYLSVFGVTHPNGASTTLLDALSTGGGGKKALGRHSVAALLNTQNSGVNYRYTAGDVISWVQEAYANVLDVEGLKDKLAMENERGTDGCDDGGVDPTPDSPHPTPPDPTDPPSSGGEGLTPGYWKQPHHFDDWPLSVVVDGVTISIDQSTLFSDVFGGTYDRTLLGALRAGGGGMKALGRHAVAALLNAASDDAFVDYDYSVQEVVDAVEDAVANNTIEATKDDLAAHNELGTIGD